MNNLSPTLGLHQQPFQPEGPQPLIPEMPSAAPYPVGALGPLKDVVVAVENMVLADKAIPAASALSVASLLVQGHADVETLGGPRPTSLYVLTVAKSGERKSSCDAPLMKPVYDYERDQLKLHEVEKAAWNDAVELRDAKKTQIIREAAKATGEKKTASETDLHMLAKPPSSPMRPDRLVTDPTIEGLTKLYMSGMPSLGIFSDEGGQFLGGHSMNRENRQKSMAAFNGLWQGEPIRRTRSGDGHAILYNRRMAMHLMVQPIVARALMADPMANETGFTARFLCSEPPSTIGTRLYERSIRDDEKLATYSARATQILRSEMPIDPETHELNTRNLMLSEEAKNVLVGYFNRIEKEQGKGGEFESVSAAASKSAEQAARIAGVLTLWDDLKAEEVSLGTMKNAIRLAFYYLLEAKRLTDAAIVPANLQRAENLRVWLYDSWGKPFITKRDVAQLGPNALRTSDLASEGLRLLEQHGWIRRVDPGTVIDGKTRKEAWAVVPMG